MEMSSRFVLTPGAIRDFREIYASEGMTRTQAVHALQSSAESARCEHIRPEGSQVLRSDGPRHHYLLVGQPLKTEPQPVLAVAAVDNKDPDGWWLRRETGLAPAGESVIAFGPHPGAELRFARETLGLTVEQLSSLVNLPRRRLEAWERGEVGDWKAVRKIARLVGKLHETRVLARASDSAANSR